MAGSVYATKAWKRARKEALEKSGGRCRVCRVKRKRLEIDHVYGVRVDPEHKYLQTLCASCHLIKTVIGRRSANPYTREHLLILFALGMAAQSLPPYVAKST